MNAGKRIGLSILALLALVALVGWVDRRTIPLWTGRGRVQVGNGARAPDSALRSQRGVVLEPADFHSGAGAHGLRRQCRSDVDRVFGRGQLVAA